MPYTTLSSGLTIQVPTIGTPNWHSTLLAQTWQKISEHDHTGSGKGLNISTSAIAALAVTSAKIAADAVTFAKMQNITSDRLIGRDTASSGDPEEISVGGGLEFSGSAGIQRSALTGDVTASAGSNSTTIANNAITTAKILDGAVTVAKLDSGIVQVPSGSILAYGGSAAPSGFFICDGSAVSRTTYASLFSAIGTTYGVGDGATTFNIPDLRQRFPLGKAASGTGSTLGGTGGNIDHTHTTPSHSHSLSDSGYAKIAPVQVLTVSYLYFQEVAASFNAEKKVPDMGGAPSADTTAMSNGVPLGGNTDSGGSGTSGSGNPPYQVVNFIIKV